MNSGESVKKSWTWLIGTIVISTVIATVAVYSWLDNRIQSVHKLIQHEEYRPSGISTIEVVSVIKHGENAIQNLVNCPAGKVAIGGGARIIDGGNESFLQANAPIIAKGNLPVGWYSEESISNVESKRLHSLKVYVICISMDEEHL